MFSLSVSAWPTELGDGCNFVISWAAVFAVPAGVIQDKECVASFIA